MTYDRLVCANCAAPVSEGRCPVCRASRERLQQQAERPVRRGLSPADADRAAGRADRAWRCWPTRPRRHRARHPHAALARRQQTARERREGPGTHERSRAPRVTLYACSVTARRQAAAAAAVDQARQHAEADAAGDHRRGADQQEGGLGGTGLGQLAALGLLPAGRACQRSAAVRPGCSIGLQPSLSVPVPVESPPVVVAAAVGAAGWSPAVVAATGRAAGLATGGLVAAVVAGCHRWARHRRSCSAATGGRVTAVVPPVGHRRLVATGRAAVGPPVLSSPPVSPPVPSSPPISPPVLSSPPTRATDRWLAAVGAAVGVTAGVAATDDPADDTADDPAVAGTGLDAGAGRGERRRRRSATHRRRSPRRRLCARRAAASSSSCACYPQ